jgi:hypothetical protein
MHVQREDAAQAERIVMEFLQAHGPTTMERLVRALVGLSWAQVFSAVDRLSRANKSIWDRPRNMTTRYGCVMPLFLARS